MAATGTGRDWLNRNLFPEPQQSSGFSARRASVVALVGLLLVAVQVVRIWSSMPLNSIWAEDGYVFLGDALRWSFFHALTTPYNGYLNTLSRLVAEPVSMLPIGWFAPAMALSGAVTVATCALVVWWAGAGLIKNPYLRGTLVGLMVLPSVVGVEMLDDVTYSIWILLFAGFWVLLWRPATLAGASAAGALLFLAALSNALVVLLVPLWLLRAVAIRDRRDRVIVLSFATGIILQYAISWDQRNLLGERGGDQITEPSQWHWSLLPAYLQRVVGGALSGQRITAYLWVQFGVAFLAVLTVALTLFIIASVVGTDTATRLRALLTVALSISMFLVSGYQREVGAQFYWAEGTSNVISSHYIVVPVLLLVSAVFIRLDAGWESVSVTWTSGFRIGVAAVILIATTASLKVTDSAQRGRPSWSSAIEAARAQCYQTNLYLVSVRIEPAVELSPEMPVPCSKLIGARLAAGRRPSPPDPHTSIVSPTNGAVMHGEKLIVATATDNVQITRIELFFSGPSHRNQLIGDASPGQYGWIDYWNTSRVGDGSYELRSVAIDQSGMTSQSSPVKVEVENR